ncbi:MAG TPA: hypothetical protein VH880_07905 [Anaeromyxobacteraceae bacterium]|jgi:hypothetical protein
MWLTIAIACILFAGMISILALGYRQTEKERDARFANGKQPVTADEVVSEIEHRIDSELKDVSRHLGRAAPESFAQLYRA